MQVGVGQVDITPRLGTPLCGQPFPCKAQGVHSRLFARAMCLADAHTRVVLVSADLVLIPNELVAQARAAVAHATGVPERHVILCATHTHSGPSTIAVLGSDTDAAYVDALGQHIVDAATQACQQTRDATLSVAKGRVEGYAHNRRFIMSDGTIQTHPLKLDPHTVQPEGPPSTGLAVWHAADAAGHSLAAAVNFGCHATVMERRNERISADFPGAIADHVTGALGGQAATLFLQGACGNICQVDPLDPARREVGEKWVRTMGHAIGERAVELILNESTPATGPLRVVTETIDIPRRQAAPELVQWAKRHQPLGADPPRLSDYGVERYGEIQPPAVSLAELFHTPYWADFYANEIQTLERMRAEQPVLPLTIKVVAQDNWAMVTLPCELFVEWGRAICEHSPFEHTAVVELANGWNGYIPTRKAFERQGGYETKEVTSTMLVPEAGAMVLKTVLLLLDRAKGQQTSP